MFQNPYSEIKKKIISNKIPNNLIEKIPKKWEKIGDVLIIKLTNDFEGYKRGCREGAHLYSDRGSQEVRLLGGGASTGSVRRTVQEADEI